MGDAAFLLIAKEPTTGLFIMGLGLFVGTITGYVVDKVHGKDFLRPKVSPNSSVDVGHIRGQSNSLILTQFWVMTL